MYVTRGVRTGVFLGALGGKLWCSVPGSAQGRSLSWSGSCWLRIFQVVGATLPAGKLLQAGWQSAIMIAAGGRGNGEGPCKFFRGPGRCGPRVRRR